MAQYAYLQFDTYDQAAEFLDELEQEARALPTIRAWGYAESRMRSAPWGPLSGKARILMTCSDNKLHVFAGAIHRERGRSVLVEVADHHAFRGFVGLGLSIHRTLVRAFAQLWLSGVAIGLIVQPSLATLIGLVIGGSFFYFLERYQRAIHTRFEADCESEHGIELLYRRYHAFKGKWEGRGGIPLG